MHYKLGKSISTYATSISINYSLLKSTVVPLSFRLIKLQTFSGANVEFVVLKIIIFSNNPEVRKLMVTLVFDYDEGIFIFTTGITILILLWQHYKLRSIVIARLTVTYSMLYIVFSFYFT